LESEKAEIEARFCDPDYFNNNADGFRKDRQRLSDLERELTGAYERWEALESMQKVLAGQR